MVNWPESHTIPHLSPQNATYLFLIAALCSLHAQTVRLANPSTMEFNDPTYGVSFRFPAGWTYNVESSLSFPPSPIGGPDYAWDAMLQRGSVSTRKLPGVPSWPVSGFNGVVFSYAVQNQVTPEDCSYLSLVHSQPGAAFQDVMLKGQTFHYAKSTGAGAGRAEEEEIYTTSLGTTCLIFDLAQEFVDSPPENAPRSRRFTSQGSPYIQRALQQVFKSVQINGPFPWARLPAASLTKEYVDPQFQVRFRYPAGWSFANQQGFYSPEGVLTVPQENGARGLTARAIVSDRGFPADTTLSGADFIFNVIPGESLESCSDYLKQSRNLDHISTRPVDGAPFFYATTAAAGLCHQVNETVYLQQAGGECYFFDLAIHTICTPQGGRNASPAEFLQVRYQLQSILDSVTLGK
jgi:hypothetical protein